jgi:hypothetical protein
MVSSLPSFDFGSIDLSKSWLVLAFAVIGLILRSTYPVVVGLADGCYYAGSAGRLSLVGASPSSASAIELTDFTV